MSREVKVGLLAIISISGLVAGLDFMSGSGMLSFDNQYVVKFPNTQGLKSGSPIHLRGVRVGNVEYMELDKHKQGVLFYLRIDEDIPLNTESNVTPYTYKITGSKALELELGKGLKIHPSDTLRSTVSKSISEIYHTEIEPLKIGIDSLVQNLNTLTKNILATLNSESQKNISTSLEKFSKVLTLGSQMLEKHRSEFSTIIQNTSKTSQKITQITNSISEIDPKKTWERLDSSLLLANNLMMHLHSGKGSLGKMWTDEQLYLEIKRSVTNVKELLRDFKLNPNRYINVSIFGSDDPMPYRTDSLSVKEEQMNANQ